VTISLGKLQTKEQQKVGNGTETSTIVRTLEDNNQFVVRQFTLITVRRSADTVTNTRQNDPLTPNFTDPTKRKNGQTKPENGHSSFRCPHLDLNGQPDGS
jgi:hypothetical protein